MKVLRHTGPYGRSLEAFSTEKRLPFGAFVSSPGVAP